jgi:hypothetical protein
MDYLQKQLIFRVNYYTGMMQLGAIKLLWPWRSLHQFLSSLWIVEVWRAIRPTFILLVADMSLFLLLMVFLTLGHQVIGSLPLSEGRREFLEWAHFCVTITTWLWLWGVLITELVVGSIKRFRDSLSQGSLTRENQNHG